MVNTIKDRLLIFKESAKYRLLQHPMLNRSKEADAFVRHFGREERVERLMVRHNVILAVTPNMVIRMPLDRIATARCRLNKKMLQALEGTVISKFVPKFIKEERFDGKSCFCESRLPGTVIGVPIARTDELLKKAADFITRFHKETVQNITLDEANFKRLFGEEFKQLSQHLNKEYKVKLFKIEDRIKKDLMGKRFRTVWFHGDYKIENIIFDTRLWKIRGVIDWDLSCKEGLPLLDLFYLLIYSDALANDRDVLDIFRERFVKFNFIGSQKAIIDNYVDLLGISGNLTQHLLVMFWLNHITKRICLSEYAGISRDIETILSFFKVKR